MTKLASQKILRGGTGRYTLRDLFTTSQSAPLTSPRSCEPGPGSLTLVATATGSPSITGGKWVRPRPSGGQGWAKYGAYSTQSYARSNGLMAYAKYLSTLQASYVPVCFLTTGALPSTAAALGALIANNTTGIEVGPDGVVVAASGGTAANTTMQAAVIARGNGYLYLIQGGTTFTSWTLLWVDAVGIDPALYVASQDFDSELEVDTLALLQKTGMLARDFGKTVLYQPCVTADTAYTGAADGLTYLSWTPAADETLSVYFRRTDDDNTYRLDCDQAGGTIKLYRRDTGTDTELNSGKTQTWTAGTPVRIGIIHAAGDIRTFTQIRGGNNVAKHVATGETFNLSETGVKASGFSALSNIEVWPRTFSGTDEASLA